MDFRKWMKNSQDELITRLQDCIRIPSVFAEDQSGYPYGKSVHDCLEYMLGLAQTMGFETYNMNNQVGWCEYGSGDEMVAVLGHLDVVPAGDGWSVPPYEGQIQDGKIFGRGTMDDKGPSVAALFALKAIKESGIPLKRRIRLIFGLNEETGSSDMKYYISHGGEIPVMGFTPDGEYPVINGEKGLIGETYCFRLRQEGDFVLKEIQGGTAANIVPASAFAVFTCTEDQARKVEQLKRTGIVCIRTRDGIRIEAEGISAHGGTPWEGENAIGRLLQFLDEILEAGNLKRAVHFLSKKIGMECDGRSLGIAMEDSVSGILTMNLGVIRGDRYHLEVMLNYRYPVTRSFEECAPLVRKAFEKAGFEQSWIRHKESLYMPPESELVQRLLHVYEKCTGQEAKPKSIGGGTYAKMLPNVVAFGPIFPGDEVREHKPDEFMELDRLIDNAVILAEAMCALAAD